MQRQASGLSVSVPPLFSQTPMSAAASVKTQGRPQKWEAALANWEYRLVDLGMSGLDGGQRLKPPRLWMRSTCAMSERLATGHRRSGTSS